MQRELPRVVVAGPLYFLHLPRYLHYVVLDSHQGRNNASLRWFLRHHDIASLVRAALFLRGVPLEYGEEDWLGLGLPSLRKLFEKESLKLPSTGQCQFDVVHDL